MILSLLLIKNKIKCSNLVTFLICVFYYSHSFLLWLTFISFLFYSGAPPSVQMLLSIQLFIYVFKNVAALDFNVKYMFTLQRPPSPDVLSVSHDMIKKET